VVLVLLFKCSKFFWSAAKLFEVLALNVMNWHIQSKNWSFHSSPALCRTRRPFDYARRLKDAYRQMRSHRGISGSAWASALCKNWMACMGSGSCFCVVQYKLPSHAGLFKS